MTDEATNDDVLSREISIRARVSQTGIDVAAKSRFAAAVDRLLGSMADWPSSYFEGKAAKRRLNDAIERRVLDAKANVVIERIHSATDETIDLTPLDAESARKLENRAGVAFETYEEMKRLPAPGGDDPKASEERSDEASVDEDWMNAFLRYAEDASSEELQQLWGRVLSGEIRKPGAFSRRTLRFMADLDKDVAVLCESVAPLVFQDFILTGDKWHSGPEIDKALALQTLGLVSGVGGLVSYTMAFDAKGEGTLIGRKAAIMLKGKVGSTVPFQALKLTGLGREVFSLLAEPDEFSLLRELVSHLDKSNVESIIIGPYVRTGPTSAQIRDFETVYTRPTSPSA